MKKVFFSLLLKINFQWKRGDDRGRDRERETSPRGHPRNPGFTQSPQAELMLPVLLWLPHPLALEREGQPLGSQRPGAKA